MPRESGWNGASWIVMAIVYLSIAPGEVSGQCADERIEPPGAVVRGKTVEEWTVVWWQWLMGIPDDGRNPFMDISGDHCARQQDEAVFFLPPTLFTIVFNGEPIPRDECVVPCGMPILLSLYWVLMWAPGDCEPDSMQDCADLAKTVADDVTSVEATLDGTPLPCLTDHRVVSPVFDFLLPAPPQANPFGLEEPLLRKSVSDGYWIMLKPLSPGKHTIVIHTIAGGEEIPEIWELTVAPCGGATFRRGDVDGNQVVDVSDAIATLERLRVGQPLPCLDAADSDDSGILDLTDAIYTLNHLFQGGPVPPAPGPDACGTDPTEDDVTCGTEC